MLEDTAERGEQDIEESAPDPQMHGPGRISLTCACTWQTRGAFCV